MPVCIVALNTMISVWLPAVRAHIREHRGGGGGVIPPPSLPPPPPPSLLSLSLSQFSLDPHPAKTWRRNILTHREKLYFWKMGKVLIHVPASWHVELQLWASDECMGRKMLMCWHRYLVTILGEERRGCWSWVLLLTSQWFNSSHHRPHATDCGSYSCLGSGVGYRSYQI